MNYMWKTYKIEIWKQLLKIIQGTNLNIQFFFSHLHTNVWDYYNIYVIV